MTSQQFASPAAALLWERSQLHGSPYYSPGRAPVLGGHPRNGQSRGGHSHSRSDWSGMGQVNGAARERGRSSAGQSHSSRPSVVPVSDLTMSFDPLKDLHLWTMWRVAVNGRIVDETRRRTHTQQRLSAPSAASAAAGWGQRSNGGRGPPASNPYGQALVKRPLDRFIRVENGSQDIAVLMMDPHGAGTGHLGTQQFVFYGVPRVVLGKKPKHQTHLP